MQINRGDEECIQKFGIKASRKTVSRQSEKRGGQHYDESQKNKL
jgi:hypothetical protein